MAIPSSHPVARVAIAEARERGWNVSNIGEAEVAHQLEALGYGPAAVRSQFKVGPYRLDFAIPDRKIGIEADGWVHTAKSVAERDARRDRWLSERGWMVIRIDTENGDAGEQIRRHLPAARHRAPNPDYPPERVMPAVMARLMNTDWHSMTAAANASPNHVSSDDRWTRKAREANAALDDDQAYRLGQMLKRQHYTRMGKLSAQSRRRARQAPSGDTATG